MPRKSGSSKAKSKAKASSKSTARASVHVHVGDGRRKKSKRASAAPRAGAPVIAPTIAPTIAPQISFVGGGGMPYAMGDTMATNRDSALSMQLDALQAEVAQLRAQHPELVNRLDEHELFLSDALRQAAAPQPMGPSAAPQYDAPRPSMPPMWDFVAQNPIYHAQGGLETGDEPMREPTPASVRMSDMGGPSPPPPPPRPATAPPYQPDPNWRPQGGFPDVKEEVKQEPAPTVIDAAAAASPQPGASPSPSVVSVEQVRSDSIHLTQSEAAARAGSRASVNQPTSRAASSASVNPSGPADPIVVMGDQRGAVAVGAQGSGAPVRLARPSSAQSYDFSVDVRGVPPFTIGEDTSVVASRPRPRPTPRLTADDQVAFQLAPPRAKASRFRVITGGQAGPVSQATLPSLQVLQPTTRDFDAFVSTNYGRVPYGRPRGSAAPYWLGGGALALTQPT